MNAIFQFLDLLNLPNTGLTIIILTIIIYLCLLPLTIKQQKFSKLSAKMNPELTEIREKYKGKKDQASMQAMQVEMQAVYNRYGVSQMGTCVQLLIQMPILIALYRVINNMPAYVTDIKQAFFPLVDNLIKQPGSVDFLKNQENFRNAMMFRGNLNSLEGALANNDTVTVQNTFIDVLNKASTTEMNMVAEQYPVLAGDVAETLANLTKYNSFLGINMGNAPSVMVTEAWNNGADIAWLTLFGAFAIPVLSAITQWINVKLMPQPPAPEPGANDTASQMMQSMKMMSTMMPIMSAFFCFTLPAGMGLYWVAGAVVRSIQQVIINHHMNKIDLDELIKKNVEKRKKKEERRRKALEKRGIDPDKVGMYASMNTKNVGASNASRSLTEKANQTISAANEKEGKKTAPSQNSEQKESSNPKSEPKPGSLAARANMVRDYNNRNKK
ncbi:MAG: YidC/Oxa1 family membrane protein insertase [Lachnospiraceae bacterium]|jgi:YidC/Oxa1 family membrane protein insertase|nr:YidC/Oxa1 family membrane protein insertase [Lachnospiraceae bacterium]